MKYLTLETFTDFVCNGFECPLTCCGGWRIIIDQETDRFYQSVEGEMGERLKNCINREDEKARIILGGDGFCPFLNEKGLCSIYINLGEEHLSNTCTFYPRYTFYEGDICFAGISISCPEAAKTYLTHEQPLLIDFAEDDDMSGVREDVDWELFNRAIRVFTTSVSIAQNRDCSVKERIALVVLFISGFQAYVENGNNPMELINLYSVPENYGSILDQTQVKTSDLKSKASFASSIMSFFTKMENADTKLPEMAELIRYFRDPKNATADSWVWENAFAKATSCDNEIWRENVLVYTLFKYFMPGLSERNFYDSLMLGIGTVLNMTTCIAALYEIMHGKSPEIDYIIMLIARLSRIIEHDRSAGQEINTFFDKAGYNDPGFVLKLIS